jgi:cytochrome c-type biogenesis protein CcmF
MQESAPIALLRLLQRNQRRFGGYLVHLGVVLMAIGALGKGFYGFDNIRSVTLNETFTIGEYSFTYRGIAPVACEFDDCQTTQAAVLVQTADGRSLGGVFPHRDFYPVQQHTATIADITGSFNEEVYVLLGGWDKGGAQASFHVYINPFINWVWIGGVVMVLGFVMSFWKWESVRTAERAHSAETAGAAA